MGLFSRKETAPPQAGPPRMYYDDGAEDVRVEEPSAAEVEAAVRALDGTTRTTVSLIRDFARIDVCGDAGTPGAPFVVYACADLRPKLPGWRIVTTPGASAEPRGEQVDVAIARLTGHFPPFRTTSLDVALAVTATFVASGTTDETLPWSDGDGVDDMRPSTLDWSGED